VACGGTATVEPPPTAWTPIQESDLVRSLVELGRIALAAGDLDVAEARFRRALAAQPGAVEPKVGLARTALARGELDEARHWGEEALADDPVARER
jgi:Tfp pilus assembly protein PilF